MAAPCTPEAWSATTLGLLVAVPVTMYVHRGTAAALAVLLAAVWNIADYLRPSHPWWVGGVVLAFAGFCLLLTRASTDGDGRHADMSPPVGGVAAYAQIPGFSFLRKATGALVVALVLTAAGLTWWAWHRQASADAQQAAAPIVVAVVTGAPDELTVTVRLPDEETANVTVYNSADYPVGSDLTSWADGTGLRQPVTEPYDAWMWLFPAVVVGGLALALGCRLRGSYRAVRT